MARKSRKNLMPQAAVQEAVASKALQGSGRFTELTKSLVGLIFYRFFLKSFRPYLDIRGLGWFHQYSDCGGVFCPLFAALHDRSGEMPNAPLGFFITTTVRKPVSGKLPRHFLQQQEWAVCQKWAQKKAANLFRLTACVPLCGAAGIQFFNGALARQLGVLLFV